MPRATRHRTQAGHGHARGWHDGRRRSTTAEAASVAKRPACECASQDCTNQCAPPRRGAIFTNHSSGPTSHSQGSIHTPVAIARVVAHPRAHPSELPWGCAPALRVSFPGPWLDRALTLAGRRLAPAPAGGMALVCVSACTGCRSPRRYHPSLTHCGLNAAAV